MANYYGRAWLKYADFASKSTRAEYWIFAWVSLLITFGCLTLDLTFGWTLGEIPVGPLYILYSLVVFIPSLAIVVRRLRDAGYPPTYIFMGLIPLVGGIIMIVLLCKRSTAQDSHGEDQFAPSNPDLLDSYELDDATESNKAVSTQKEVVNQIVLIILICYLFNAIKWIYLTSSFSQEGFGNSFEIHSYLSRFTYGAAVLALPFLSSNKTVRAIALVLAITFLLIENVVRPFITQF